MPRFASFLAFKPIFFQAMKGYSKEKLIKDVTAGLTVGVVALPLAMAFAIASGLTPQTGIFTAIIAGFLISMLGGSKVQIGGPAGAFIVIVYGIVERYGLSNLIIAVAMSGVFLFLMGRFKLGTLIRFIPVSVVIGFTNGIAVLIALSQFKDFFGMKIDKMPADFFGVLKALWQHIHTVNFYAIAVAVASLVIIIVWQNFTPGLMKNKLAFRGKLTIIPGSIVALVITSVAVKLLNLQELHGIETIGSRFGGIPAELPKFIIPELNWESARFLLMPSLTLAILGAIESLLCARVADSVTGDRHDPNQELMAQGIANMATSFFGGMPATGTIARTVTNIKSGASTPVAGMVHALVLLLVVLIAAPLAAAVPLPTLAAVLVFVAWNMGEWREFARLRNYTMTYRVTLLAVFFLTVIVDLTVAVEVGLVTSLLTFLYSMSSLSRSEKMLPAGTVATGDGSADTETQLQQVWNDTQVRVWRLHGTLFFGAVQLIEQIADNLPERVLVMDFKNLLYMDASGAEEIVQLTEQAYKRGITVILSGLDKQPLDKARRVGLIHLPGVLLANDLDQAIANAQQMIEPVASNS